MAPRATNGSMKTEPKGDLRDSLAAERTFLAWIGTALIALGVIVNLLSAWNHLRLVRELNRGGSPPLRPSAEAVLLALLLALVGLAMAIYLVYGHISTRL